MTAAVPERGLGIALKIADGNARPRATALLAVLSHLGILSEIEKTRLREYFSPSIENSRTEKVGEMRPAQAWLPSASRSEMRNATPI